MLCNFASASADCLEKIDMVASVTRVMCITTGGKMVSRPLP
jgi:hypothetical protein